MNGATGRTFTAQRIRSRTAALRYGPPATVTVTTPFSSAGMGRHRHPADTFSLLPPSTAAHAHYCVYIVPYTALLTHCGTIYHATPPRPEPVDCRYCSLVDCISLAPLILLLVVPHARALHARTHARAYHAHTRAHARTPHAPHHAHYLPHLCAPLPRLPTRHLPARNAPPPSFFGAQCGRRYPHLPVVVGCCVVSDISDHDDMLRCGRALPLYVALCP